MQNLTHLHVSRLLTHQLLRHVLRPGDVYFASGDLLRRDSFGFYFWVDRMGDTFRLAKVWKCLHIKISTSDPMIFSRCFHCSGIMSCFCKHRWNIPVTLLEKLFIVHLAAFFQWFSQKNVSKPATPFRWGLPMCSRQTRIHWLFSSLGGFYVFVVRGKWKGKGGTLKYLKMQNQNPQISL